MRGVDRQNPADAWFRPFRARLLARLTVDGKPVYVFVEQQHDASSGDYSTQQPARTGSARELNDRDLDVSGNPLVMMRFKGLVAGEVQWEFDGSGESASSTLDDLPDIGTIEHRIPVLDGSNTWSDDNTYIRGITIPDPVYYNPVRIIIDGPVGVPGGPPGEIRIRIPGDPGRPPRRDIDLGGDLIVGPRGGIIDGPAQPVVIRPIPIGPANVPRLIIEGGGVISLPTTGSPTITGGSVPDTPGTTITIYNPGPGTPTLVHEDESASPGEAWSISTDGDYTIPIGTSVPAWWDGTQWVVQVPTDGMTNPMTTLGDVIYATAGGTPARLAGNTTATRKFLAQTGDGSDSAAPVWYELPLASATPPASVSLGSVPQWFLVRTITHADLTDADLEQDVTAYTLPAKGAFHGMLVRTKTVASGGGVTSLTLTPLKGGGVVASWSVGSGISADDVSCWGIPNSTGTVPQVSSWTATTTYGVRFTADVNVANLTGGEWEVYLLLATLG